MDIDEINDYVQVDRFRHLLEPLKQLHLPPKQNKSSSSLSDLDEADFGLSETPEDYVFLPSLNNNPDHQTLITHPLNTQSKPSFQQQTRQLHTIPSIDERSPDQSDKQTSSVASHKNVASLTAPFCKQPGSNPFATSAISPMTISSPSSSGRPTNQQFGSGGFAAPECYLSGVKPIGPIESDNASANPNKVAELMQQIVTRSDLIYLAIPCTLCAEQIACPPSDISAWLNHMNTSHNCRACPICNRLIGLGPIRDLAIMKCHVLEHLDQNWLDQRHPSRVGFTFGLQQQWFYGGRCSVREPRLK